MSDLIRLLPDHIANQIAAGEVIQRPASVVKEMMENAIDAGADKIHVVIKDAGRTLIRIVDNGKGMSPNDAILCFDRHATSKVRSADDLFALTTKGFRGEALASVAAIAHVSLQTRREEDETGRNIVIEGTKIKSNEACVCPVGSTFDVKNLFFNVPARRNFLKTDNVEFNHIREEFERVVLAHPNLGFVLVHNDVEIYQLAPGVLRKRIVDVLGKGANDKLVPVEEKTDIVTLTGFVLKPEFARKTRGEQYLFVNDRYFRDNYLGHAVNKAFDGLLAAKNFPGYFLYLTVDPKKIDVNVHPTKTEIKFEEDKHIYMILLSAIKQTLGKYNVMPSLDFDQESSFDLPYSMKNQPVVEPEIKVNPMYNPFNTTSSSGNSKGSSSGFTKAVSAQGFGSKIASPEEWENFYSIEEEVKSEQGVLIEHDEEDSNESRECLIKGKYLITTCRSGLLVIDIQRAFERMIYDELFNNFISNPIESQALLFPVEKNVSKQEASAWEEQRQMLSRLGFQWEINDSVLSLSAVPSVLVQETILTCIDLILEEIAYKTIDKGDIAHLIVRSVASAAGRKKQQLTGDAANHFIELLFACSEHALTPSGKKIMQTLTTDEISNRF
ncbi:MAG: DNA mismatch repair endonuclease MutL [Flavobacteriia bacterium]|jgi:DNA mismatch repair protein MutL